MEPASMHKFSEMSVFEAFGQDYTNGPGPCQVSSITSSHDLKNQSDIEIEARKILRTAYAFSHLLKRT